MRTGFLLLFFLTCLQWAMAQPSDDPVMLSNGAYDVRQYNSENGLPQNSASDLLLDRQNFLWIATQNGIVRFDGQRFRLYNSTNTPALKVNRFSVVSAAGDQVFFRSSFDAPEIYEVTPDYKILLDSPATRLPYKLVSPHSNGIFDCSSLFSYYAGSKDPLIDTTFLKELCSSDVYRVLNQQEAVVWYHNDWYYLNNLPGRVTRLPIRPETWSIAPEFLIGDIFCIARRNGEIVAFKGGQSIEIRTDSLLSALIKNGASLSPTQFFVYTKGGQCIIRSHNDWYTVKLEGNRLVAVLVFKDLPFLQNLSPSAIQYDEKAERLFIGTLNAGLFVFTKKVFGTLTFNTRNLIDNAFMALQSLPGGNILSHNGILNRNEEDKNRLFDGNDRIDRNCLYKDKDQSIWVSKEKHLLIYNSDFSKMLRADSMDLDSYVTSIVKDPSQGVWVSTLYSLLKMKDGKLQYVLNKYPSFANHTIESMAEVLPGKLWIATRSGLYVYDIAAGRMEEKPLLPGVYVRNIFKAKDSSIWIGTYGNGFFKYQHGAFIPLPLDPERYLTTAHSFLEDDHGFFWISTNHGLFKIWKKDLDSFAAGAHENLFYYYYEKSAGFNTNEFNGGCNPAALKDKDGYFYFPSLNGVVYFHPDSDWTELPDRPIFIDNVAVDSIDRDYTKPLTLKPDFNRIAVAITTPFYGTAENLQLEYKLDNIGGKWYPVSRDGKIIINRLPYGKYSLLIRKASGWGIDHFTYNSVSFEVLPRWYDTRWFYILLIIVIAAIAGFLYRLRAGMLMRQNVRLQVKVNERTAELEQSMILRERLIGVIMHDLRSPLFSQDMLIGYLYDRYKDLAPADLKELLFQLRDSSKSICQFSTDFLAWYNTQQKGFLLERKRVELMACIEEASLFYKEIAERVGLTFEYDVAPGLFLFSDRHILAIVIRNLVDNAVKYTQSGGVRIIAFAKDTNLYIKVEDTGKGMTAEKIGELLSYPESNSNTRSTFGYRFIMELTRQLGGTVDIKSQPGVGTTVTLGFEV